MICNDVVVVFIFNKIQQLSFIYITEAENPHKYNIL